jgi:diguanylate cyclase (GGDEF)-like protein
MANQIPAGLVEALGSVVRRRLPEALDELLKALELVLAEQRLRAFSNQEAQACDDFQRLCRKHGEWLQTSLCSSICRYLPQGTAAQPTLLDEQDEWGLVDDSEVEDMLLARRLVRILREPLGKLEWRACACLNRLAGQHVADADNPLSLEFLLRQLQAGLRLQAQPTVVRELFLAQTARILGVALQTYFEELVAQFDRHHVTPLPAPEAPGLGRRMSTGSDSAPPEAIWQAARGLHRAGGGGASPPGEPAAQAAAVPLSQALVALQAQPAPQAGWQAPELLEQLEQQGCRLSSRQREDTHLLSEMFQALVREPRVAPGLKPALQRLLLPVLEATLREPAAIADASHPVRATLDRVLRLSDYCEPPNKALESRLEDVIGRMVADPGELSAHDAELDELLQLQQRAYRHAAERVMQQHRGRDILEKAQRDVAAAVAGLVGEQAPKLLYDWLDAGWRELLVNELIRLGGEDYSWRIDLALTSLLAKRLQESPAALSEAEQVARSFDVEHMLQILRRRMDEFGAGRFQHGPVLGELRRQLFGESPVELVAPLSPPPAPTPIAAGQQRWLERLEALNEGDWLHDSDGQALQLIWRNAAADHYVLVDAQGREVGCHGAAEMAGMLAEGRLMIGELAGGDSLIQRTLQDMVGRLYREIAHARSHDELTGLLNRRSFDGAVAQALSATALPSFLMLHIDQFSLINSSAGPLAGDACLRLVAEQLAGRLPEGSVLARLGGVEFAAVLPACEQGAAMALAEELRAAVEAAGFAWEGHRHGLTLSIGVVEAAERHDVANLLCDLHAACNQAKESGRNRVHRFDSEADEARTGLLAIASRVDDIVEREDLSLRVQQIAPADPQADELPHYELLLVMQNELQLQDFIAAAERYHRMNKVDRWVLRRIFIELERCPQVWQHSTGLSINLSGSSLNDDKLLGFIESLFERYAVPPQHVCFELTETAAVANLGKTADLVRHLQRAGCTFSIDDFGVGFSSFDYLKRLPVDYVKIDGSFVREIERSSSDLAMVRSINEIAHALGRRTIAEYVETPSIRNHLAEMGVDYVQGFGVQRPRTLGDWLAAALPAVNLSS